MNFHEDDRAQRLLDIFPAVNGQVNISYVNSTEHVVAWHRHQEQIDYWCCVKGAFKVGLYDPIHQNLRWEYLSDKNLRTIQINPPWWHGYKALEPNSIMLYYLTEKYDPTDEWKVLPGYFGEDWSTISQ